MQHEHEFEPEHGLPEHLPHGEAVLWQGSPNWREVAVHVFHIRKLTVYFALLLLLKLYSAFSERYALAATAWSVLGFLTLSLLVLCMVGYVSYLSARTTVYTITNKRVVMRIGIVLTITFNLPFRQVEQVYLSKRKNGAGDIVIGLPKLTKIAYFHLWPHARPWSLRNPEPAIRCINQVESVAVILRSALVAELAEAGHTIPAKGQSPVSLDASNADDAAKLLTSADLSTPTAVPAH